MTRLASPAAPWRRALAADATTYLFVSLGALALAALFVRRLATYWHFFHLGAGSGPGLFLYYVGAPVSAALAVLVGLGVAHATRQAEGSPAAAVGRALAVVALVFGLLFSVELWRTRADRAPEAEPPGTLREYFARHPW